MTNLTSSTGASLMLARLQIRQARERGVGMHSRRPSAEQIRQGWAIRLAEADGLELWRWTEETRVRYWGDGSIYLAPNMRWLVDTTSDLSAAIRDWTSAYCEWAEGIGAEQDLVDALWAIMAYGDPLEIIAEQLEYLGAIKGIEKILGSHDWSDAINLR